MSGVRGEQVSEFPECRAANGLKTELDWENGAQRAIKHVFLGSQLNGMLGFFGFLRCFVGSVATNLCGPAKFFLKRSGGTAGDRLF